MKLEYLDRILPPQSLSNQEVSSIKMAMAWAPNNTKLAICGQYRTIFVFDEDGQAREKFPAKAAENLTSVGPNGEVITRAPRFKVLDMAFSPCSTKLATAQSDDVVHVFKMGEGFNSKEKKTILAKLEFPKSVTRVVWGSELEIICGLLNGELRHTPMSGNRTPRGKTFYDAEYPCVSLVSRHLGTELAAGFADGTIALFTAGTGDLPTLKYTMEHTCAPEGLLFGGETILVGGSDMMLVSYHHGKSVQVFDYAQTGDSWDVEFCAADSSPNEQFAVFGANHRIRVYQYLVRRKVWQEIGVHEYPGLYLISYLKWSPDGTTIAAGSEKSSVHLLEANMRKDEDDLYDVVYTTKSKIMIQVKTSDLHLEVQANDDAEILDVRVMGRQLEYAIASTMETFIFCDIPRRLVTEIDWPDNEGTERFYFDNPTVCIVFNVDYFTIVEYGAEGSLGSYRTELANPHVVSVRVNERMVDRNPEDVGTKKLAYLVDIRSISVVDLDQGTVIGHVSHDAKIDWLELNELGNKLLYRDTKLRLTLVDAITMNKTRMVTNCSFVQWAPGSDVVVAQTGDKLCVWYNIKHPEQITNYEAKGVAYNVVKGHQKTYVQVSEGGGSVNSVHLDESMIEFTAAMDEGDLLRAVLFLEIGSDLPEEQNVLMWKQLQRRAMELGDLVVFERAAAGSNDVARTKYVRDTLAVAKTAMDDEVEPHVIQNEIEARIALLNNQTEEAELAFSQNDDAESCISMYETVYKWQDALRLATTTDKKLLPRITENFLAHLLQTGQEELAGDFLQYNDNYEAAIETFLNAGVHTKAAMVIKSHYNQIQVQPEWIEAITKGLLDSSFYPEAGEFFEVIGKNKEALDCYKKAKLFHRAVSLAKDHYPHMVVDLEEEWGNDAYASREFDEACTRYIECGKNKKALQAAISARHWERAMHIISIIEDPGDVMDDYEKLAQHFEKAREFRQAELCYAKINQVQKSVDMYLEHELYEDAYRLSKANPNSKKDIERSFMSMAHKLQDAGKFKSAEDVLTAIGDTNAVINMYAKKKMYTDMLRVVAAHHPSHVDASRRHVAELLQKEGHFRSAESFYLKSNDYREALNMYESIGQWEDAYRVAREYGGPEIGRRVVYKWADSLGGETGLQLLRKYNCIDGCVAYLCDLKKFDYAFDVVQEASREAQIKYNFSFAEHFAGLGDYKQAAMQYVYAGSVKSAIDMYMNVNLIEEAAEIAIEYGTREEVDEVLIRQAHKAFDQGEYRIFETALLKSEKPEIAIRMYKEHGMWTEAFRVCKEYAPILLQSLENEYEGTGLRIGSGKAGKNGNETADQLLQQAKDFERIGEYKHSIDCYLRINGSICPNEDFVAQCWLRAGSMAVTHLDVASRPAIVSKIATALKTIRRYQDAGMMYINANMKRESLDAFMDGHLWNDAKNAASNWGPEMVQYVVQRHTVWLQTSGSVDELSNVNLTAALKLLAEKGDWDTCLQKAKATEETLHQYMGHYIRQLLKIRDIDKVIKVYLEYGVPYVKSHFDLFKEVATSCFIKYEIDDYDKWLNLRNTLTPMIKKLEDQESESPLYIEYKTLFFIIHLHTTRAACIGVPGLEIVPTKISVSLLRYTNILPPEKYFYEAGFMCKKGGLLSMAFVFLNHYMDIREAKDDGKKDTSMMDYSALVGTDIPNDVPLLNCTIMPPKMDNEAREWIISASMDGTIDPVILKNARGNYVASLKGKDGSEYLPCVVTGYPALGEKITFRKGFCANKDDWNRLVVTAKSAQAPKASEVYQFITEWCGSNPNYSI